MIAESKTNRALLASVNALSAQDTFGVFKISRLNQLSDIKAHGAMLGATLAFDASACISGKMKRRQAKRVANLSPKNHKGRHPANSVARATPARNKRNRDEERKHRVVNHIAKSVRDGNAVLGLIKEVNAVVSTCEECGKSDRKNPRGPDCLLYPIARLFEALVVDRRKHFLKSCTRTRPAAPCATQHHRAKKHHCEDDKTAIDQSFRCAFKNQDWRGVKKRDGKQKLSQGGSSIRVVACG